MRKILILFFISVVFTVLFSIISKRSFIPSDTIVGLYHPFRDYFSKEYPRGIPFKNFLVTDPVRQQYPWKNLATSVFKKTELPLWNPYTFAGYPLLANIQTGAFYVFNILFFLFPFQIGWNIFLLFQLIFLAIFTILYLKNLRLHNLAITVGTIAVVFSGYSVVWFEWGNILHTTLWLPLILLSIDKIREGKKSWHFILIFALCSSFFAGHLQLFFYISFFSFCYFLIEVKNRFILKLFILDLVIFFIIASVQWIPLLKLITMSARDVDQSLWQSTNWFIPWQNIIQFLIPDFFGNPTTLNYWGEWNYAEFIGYIGVIPLCFALYAIYTRRDKRTIFFSVILLVSLIFAFPTFLSKIPFIFRIPLLSTSQPTRLLAIIDFSLPILCALGIDSFLKSKKRFAHILIFIFLIFIASWFFTIYGNKFFNVLPTNIFVSQRNIIFPFSIFFLFYVVYVIYKKISVKYRLSFFSSFLIMLVLLDLLRFSYKFTPFVDNAYLYPQTKILEFLSKNIGISRYMTTDSRIMPPNFSVIYRLQTVDGYDPLYIKRYAELIAASERGRPDILPPFGFNRIITPHNHNSKIIDLLGVKYILSLSDIQSSKLKKVFQEGETRVYENISVLPRAFLVDVAIPVGSKQDAMEMLFDNETNLRKVAFFEVEDSLLSHPKNRQYKPIFPLKGNVRFITYSENYIGIETQSNRSTFLVITDTYYPTWHAKIDGIKTNIYRTDYNFRGINIPKGKHVVEFYTTMF